MSPTAFLWKNESTAGVQKHLFFSTMGTFSSSFFLVLSHSLIVVVLFSLTSLKFLLCPTWGKSSGTSPAWRPVDFHTETKVVVSVSSAPSPLFFCYSYLSVSPPRARPPRLSLYFDMFTGLLLFSVRRPQNTRPCHAHIGTQTHIYTTGNIFLNTHTHSHTYTHLGLMPWYT